MYFVYIHIYIFICSSCEISRDCPVSSKFVETFHTPWKKRDEWACFSIAITSIDCASYFVYCCRCGLKLSMNMVTRRGYSATLAYYKLRGDCGKPEHKLVSWPSYCTDKCAKLFDWFTQWTYCLLYMRIFYFYFSISSNAIKQWSLPIVNYHSKIIFIGSPY